MRPWTHAGACRNHGPGAPLGGSRRSCIPVMAAEGRPSPPPPVHASSSRRPLSSVAALRAGA
eukprot:2802394-Pyramimonas_sp.AAC.1